MINDGLWDVFNGYHMGITAENVATQQAMFADVRITSEIFFKSLVVSAK